MPLADRNFLERRAHTRYPVSIPAVIDAAPGAEPLPATVVDISLGGALLVTPQQLEPGSTVSIELHASPHFLWLFARVVATSEEGPSIRVHVAFTSTDKSTLMSLIDQLASRSGTPHDRARRAAVASPRTFRL
ncbi:MAG: PilZ domain-containing protein [Dehalococcoidia bacterium]|nr:PilZ domain-containing protein [Dehalococcoidia bacterium]MCB9485283.1 PilZ domain-containing protein [Thermoflexaceae bacterium]